jgi:hypothetical protein
MKRQRVSVTRRPRTMATPGPARVRAHHQRPGLDPRKKQSGLDRTLGEPRYVRLRDRAFRWREPEPRAAARERCEQLPALAALARSDYGARFKAIQIRSGS